jgi:two-component system, OmpR family, phosphate regulon sensor histidine kinase PhoR
LRVNIHYKITLIFTIITAGILLGIYFYLNTNLRNYIYGQIRKNLEREMSLTKNFVEVSSQNGFRDADKLANGIGKDLNLRVTIIGLSGKVLGDSELDGEALEGMENHLYRPEVQDAVNFGAGENRRFSDTLKKEMLYMASVFGRPDVRGIIRLAIPLSDIEVVTGHLKKTMAFSLFLAFIFAIIISFIASLLISRPIKEISYMTKNVAGGDFSKKINISTNDEIEALGDSFNDMSDQIRSRIEEISSSRSRLEAVLLSMFEGLMVLDAKGSVLLMNKTLKGLLSIKEDITGKKPIEVIRNVEIQEIVENTLKLKLGVETREIHVLPPSEKILLIHGTPVINNEKIEGIVLVFHDITDLRRLEKVRQDFVANVSHELRTPVSNIKGYTETLLEGAIYDKNNAVDFLNIIHSDSDRLSNIINDLLELSGIESGVLKMTIKPRDIAPIVKAALSGFGKQLKTKSLTLKIDMPENLPAVLVDEARLTQVITNLAENAIKYNKDNGRIVISAGEEKDFVRVKVSDTGFGIPEKDLPRIFERFYRVDKARSRELGGTGLGLSIVKHIVHAHGGEVFVESMPGKGTAFSFTIPKA